MDDFGFIFGGIIFFYTAIIALVIFISWQIGKFIGTRLSQTTGLIVGIVLILCGFTLFVAIPCIIYSQKNKNKSLVLDLNINSNVNSNINNSDTKECPYCAETIKFNAKICRFCNRAIS